MSSFALILWVFAKHGSAMEVSLMAFFNYLPYIVVSVFAGGFVDRHRKKRILLLTDFVAALGSLLILIIWKQGGLRVWQIYLVNFVSG